jgi:hypothetical protein
MAIVFTAQEGRNFVNANIHGYGDYDYPYPYHSHSIYACANIRVPAILILSKLRKSLFILPLLTLGDLALNTY